jgi:predicted RNA binding protein YcfA (HicA-like mRNA interferase family)
VPRLPRISGREALRAFERDGWVHRRTSGDHMQLTKPGFRTLVVPDHRELRVGTLRGLIRSAGLSVDRFVALLQGA